MRWNSSTVRNVVGGLAFALVLAFSAEQVFAQCSATPEGSGCESTTCSVGQGCPNSQCDSFGAGSSDSNLNCSGEAGCKSRCEPSGPWVYKCCNPM